MKNNFEKRIRHDAKIPYIHLQEGEYDLYHGCGGAIVKVSDGIIDEIIYLRNFIYDLSYDHRKLTYKIIRPKKIGLPSLIEVVNKKDINEFEKLLQVNDYWLGELSCYDLCCPIRVKDIHLLIEKIKEEEMKEEAELPLI